MLRLDRIINIALTDGPRSTSWHGPELLAILICKSNLDCTAKPLYICTGPRESALRSDRPGHTPQPKFDHFLVCHLEGLSRGWGSAALIIHLPCGGMAGVLGKPSQVSDLVAKLRGLLNFDWPAQPSGINPARMPLSFPPQTSRSVACQSPYYRTPSALIRIHRC